MKENNNKYVACEKTTQGRTLNVILQFIFSVIVTISAAILNNFVFNISIETLGIYTVIMCLFLCTLSIIMSFKRNNKSLTFIISICFNIFYGFILSITTNYSNIPVLVYGIAIMSILCTLVFGITCIKGRVKYIFLSLIIASIICFEIFLYKFLLVDLFKISDLYVILDFILYKVAKSLILVLSVITIFYGFEKLKSEICYKQEIIFGLYLAFFIGINSILGGKLSIGVVLVLLTFMFGILSIHGKKIINECNILGEKTC